MPSAIQAAERGWVPSAARVALEKATRRIVFRRRLPSAFGHAPMVVSPAAGLRYLARRMRNIDPVLLAHAREFVHEGHVVWDVGANVGLFSVAAAAMAGPRGAVISIEPDVWLVQLLRQTAGMQASTSASMTIVPCGIARGVGLRSFCIASRSRSSNYLAEYGYGHSQTGGEAERQTIVTLALDDLLRWLPAPAVVKVDVEGAEREVLAGAEQLLTKYHPTLILEVGDEASDEIAMYLREKGYVLFDGEQAGPKREPVERATWSTIAVSLPHSAADAEGEGK